jgi:hypothetical protein
MRKNSSREQIVETTADEGTQSFLTHHATGEVRIAPACNKDRSENKKSKNGSEDDARTWSGQHERGS